ncbi:MAG: hypothetical protein JW910_18125 [Anaerolineae bacterium]|nr:hypothetical protein [Anaerolineae bacterium]
MTDQDNTPITRPGPGGKLWYVVATVNGDELAALVAGQIESAGIPVWVYREAAGRAIGLTMGLLGASDVLVPEEYYEDALNLLDAEDEDDPALDDGVPPLDDGNAITPE